VDEDWNWLIWSRGFGQGLCCTCKWEASWDSQGCQVGDDSVGVEEVE